MFRTVLCILLIGTAWSPADASGLQTRLRRPVAIDLSADGGWLYVANRDAGSISVVDTSTRSVAAEIDLGGRLSDLALVDENRLLVLDEGQHQLVFLTGGNSEWSVAQRLHVAEYPVRLAIDQERSRCYVTSLWSQCVTVVYLTPAEGESPPSLKLAETLDVPFEPRELCLAADDTRLIVAGAFQGALAVFDTTSRALLADHPLPGHNIRGLATVGPVRQLLVTQQELNPIGRATQDDVHWGNVITNELVSLPLFDVCDPEADLRRLRSVVYLGEAGRGAGDPGQIAVGNDGRFAVVLSGVHEVALLQDVSGYVRHRIPVGSGPQAIVLGPNDRMYVADTFADTISIVDTEEAKVVETISLGPQPELSLAERGETLFFDARLSHDGWMSCHSCHTNGHSNGALNDNLSDGSFGAPKRVLSLLGVADTGPWAWGGNVKTLEEQMKNSIHVTMQGSAPADEEVAALVGFLGTLHAPPPLADNAHAASMAEVERGAKLFDELDCRRCHQPPTFTSPSVYDVGLHDARGNNEFNPPSLRGVGRRTALLHDGRATSLAEVFESYEHQLPRQLSTAERDAIVRYLETL